ncbi:MAG: hypothetical protein F4047_17315 [Caldilineaceae bacterium SB0670_bin_27]|uniref:Uncharacterized protein n=1 Tax=Caldilineaceae bacterium SB0664_bin_27 TaxID=2605260 RepID=A0A6B0YX68_9CHLR|nr:hypothetical protein [Caldilineaceae bacterium SB0664_bin_27]MYJ79856.1 hypothetical protein [Caldilineaceae bacterium SB0670_bin_27]
MGWTKHLGKDNRGSRPRCVLLLDGGKEEVAARLTRLVGVEDVTIAGDDIWQPRGKPVQKLDGSWDTTTAEEVELDKPTDLLPLSTSERLRNWWLAASENRPRTPNWDIASTCTIRGAKGLLLVEAKAHWNELARSSEGKRLAKSASVGTLKNHEKIGTAIEEAAVGLRAATGGSWRIARDTHYQLSNRFAWSWKLASLGTPVVLVYLGFLYATDIAKGGNLFHSEAHWERIVKGHCEGVVDSSCWGQWLDVNRVPMLPLIRALNQPFRNCGD